MIFKYFIADIVTKQKLHCHTSNTTILHLLLNKVKSVVVECIVLFFKAMPVLLFILDNKVDKQLYFMSLPFLFPHTFKLYSFQLEPHSQTLIFSGD